jgi:hypothetical protein
LPAAEAADFIGHGRQAGGESENYCETKKITDARIVSVRRVHVMWLDGSGKIN